MNGQDEVLARFIPDVRRLGCSDPGVPMATILVRSADGRMSLQPVDPDATLGQEALATGAFRKGNPIVDPVSRRILGYEMEPANVLTLRVQLA
jgi:hypothetical protein